MTTPQLQAVVGVPVTVPEYRSMDSPIGSPVADHDSAADGELSDPDGVRGAMAPPDWEVWFPIDVTDTVSVTVQVKPVEPLPDVASVAVRTTG